MASLLATMWRDQRSQDLTEYALMGGLVASVAVGIAPDMLSIAAHVHTVLLGVVKAAADVATLK